MPELRDKELHNLLREAAVRFNALSPTDREAVMRQQRDGWVKAEMALPRPKYEVVNGVKVYASYEDYCLD